MWRFQPSLRPHAQRAGWAGWAGRQPLLTAGLGAPVLPAVGGRKGAARRPGLSRPSIRSRAMRYVVNALLFLRQKHGCQSPPQGSVGTGTEQQP